MSRWRSAGIIALAGVCGAAFAQQRARAQEPSHAVEQPGRAGEQPGPAAAVNARQCRIDIRGEKKDQWMRLPNAESSVTQHRLNAGGKSFDYTATAGTLIIRDDEDRPTASMGYVAYVRHDLKGAAARPLMFAFNGGPGSSSLWLHMGVLGPRRVVVSDPGPTPAGPYRTVDNEFGVLDKSDLVMIDPVGTGLSHAVCDHRDDEFWAVDPDIDSVSRFIAQYVSDNNRWTSPKYLLGESYGTTRGAAIVNYLRGRRSFAFNGLILVSVATDIEAIFAELPGNDRPYAVYLPGYAAVAWYHHMLPSQPAALEPFLTEVRAYAMGPFTAALLKGDALADAEREAVAQKMHEYTASRTSSSGRSARPSGASTGALSDRPWIRWKSTPTMTRSRPRSAPPLRRRSSTTTTGISSSGRAAPTAPPISASANTGSGCTRPSTASSPWSIQGSTSPRRW